MLPASGSGSRNRISHLFAIQWATVQKAQAAPVSVHLLTSEFSPFGLATILRGLVESRGRQKVTSLTTAEMRGWVGQRKAEALMAQHAGA